MFVVVRYFRMFEFSRNFLHLILPSSESIFRRLRHFSSVLGRGFSNSLCISSSALYIGRKVPLVRSVLKSSRSKKDKNIQIGKVTDNTMFVNCLNSQVIVNCD